MSSNDVSARQSTPGKSRNMKKTWFATVLFALIAAALFAPKSAKSYLTQYSSNNGTISRSRWDFSQFPVQWNLNPVAASNVSGAPPAQEVVASSFATWMAAPNTTLSVTRGGDAQISSPAYDGINLICFTCSTNFNSDGALAITFTT